MVSSRPRRGRLAAPLLLGTFLLATTAALSFPFAFAAQEATDEGDSGICEEDGVPAHDAYDLGETLIRDVMRNANATNEYLDVLADISDSDFHLERTFLSPGSLRALASVRRWMEDAGLRTWLDSVGNLHGRLEQEGEYRDDARVLLLGSHIDTVVDGGAYDGTLGIVSAITAVKNLKLRLDSDASLGLRRPVEVIAFSDEEGLRFKSTFLGSRAVSGTFLKNGYLQATDSKGYTLASVLETVGLSNSEEDIAKIAMRREDLYGYVEVHIEQGPVLQSLNQPVGVVSAISGQTRMYVQVDGFSGHAGTVPMDQRRDTIAASAEMITRIEDKCNEFPLSRENMLVCTVGEFNVFPGASNVIPGYANFSVDIRCKDDAMRGEVVSLVKRELLEISKRRKVECEIQMKHSAESCQSSPTFTESLRRGILGAHELVGRYEEAREKSRKTGPPDPDPDPGGQGEGESLLWDMNEATVPVIASGAGHDALAMSEVTPIGMLFVRCRDGISHSPLEHVEPRDVTVASLSLYQFLVSEALLAA